MDLLSKSSPTGKDFASDVRLDLDTVITTVDPLLAIEHVLSSQLNYESDHAGLMMAARLLSEYLWRWPNFEPRKKAAALMPSFKQAADLAGEYASVVMELAQDKLHLRKEPLWACRRHAGRHEARAEIAALAVEVICIDDESRRTEIAQTIVGYACSSATASGVMLDALVQLIEEEKKLLSLELHPIIDDVVKGFWPDKWAKSLSNGLTSVRTTHLIYRFRAQRIRAEYRASLKT